MTPPSHPNCRCSVSLVIDDWDYASNKWVPDSWFSAADRAADAIEGECVRLERDPSKILEAPTK